MALEQAPDWKPHLAAEFEQPYMQQLKQFLQSQKQQHKVIYPHSENWFHALETTPLADIKVVILGQDPYHQPGQAHGLCFSVRPGIKPPPSLVNIFKELHSDLGIEAPVHGYLESWAKNGVLLLNAVLTVEQNQANAHQGKGWEQFTDKVIEIINRERENVVFMLWGSYAQKKGAIIDAQRHCVLKAPHPSPLSAHRGFFGCQHFSKANAFLQQQGIEPVDWALPLQVENN